MKIVITDHRFPHIEPELSAVKLAGWDLVVGQAKTEDQLVDLCRDADGVLAGRALITERVIGAMEHCRVIVRYGIGIETIDIPAATKRGIMVANVPDYCVDEVSDHALMFLLMLSRQTIPAMALAMKEVWSVAPMPPLHRLRGQVCGLFGFGRIASLLAHKVLQLGMKVVFYDAYRRDSRMTGVNPCSFDMLLECSDFISLHVPLTKETRHRFAESAFLKMKKSASIINTARGELIDQVALVAALDSGQISGAALDVLEPTEISSPLAWTLRDHPRIILTPHSAWLSEEARTTLQASAVQQVIAGLRGEKPYGIVNAV